MLKGREPYFTLQELVAKGRPFMGVQLFLAVYFGSYVVAALLAPPIYGWVQILSDEFTATPLQFLSGESFVRYVDRIRLMTTVGAVVWLIGRLRLWGRFGFVWDRPGIEAGLSWGLVGVLMLGVPALIQWMVQFGHGIGPDGLGLLVALCSALFGGVAVGFLEEAIFRGMLLRLFYTAMAPWSAVLLSSFVFAAVHFKGVDWSPHEEVHWWSGWVIGAKGSLGFFFQFDPIYFLNLFLSGIVLNLLFLRNRNLVSCLSLHAGWVLVISWWRQVWYVDPPGVPLLGSGRLADGWLATTGLLMVGAYLVFKTRENEAILS